MIDESSLIWKGFDKVHVDFPDTKEQQVLAGIERFNEARFKREYTVFKMNHFASRIITLDDKFELPYNSILHVADNFGHIGDFVDTPRSGNIFIDNESLRKYIFHVHELDTSGSAVYPDKYILRFSGLPTSLMKFRSEHGSEFKYLNGLEEVPAKRDALTIINHNPLFRMKMYGRIPFYRTCTQILASILNTCEKLKKLNKHQFIVLPWDDEVFNKDLFVRSREQLTFMSVRRPNSFHYILMMHLVNYMWEGATTSIFSKFDKDVLSQITIVLQHNDKYVFLNLGDIKALNTHNVAYFKFVNQLNLLSILGRVNADENFDVRAYIDQDTENTSSPVVSSSFKTTVINEFTKTPETQVSEDEVQEEVVQKLDTSVPKQKIETDIVRAVVNTNVPDKTTMVTKVTPTGKKETKVATVAKAANITQVVEKATKDTHSIEYMRDLDADTIDFIDNNENLTPAAKQYYKKVAQKYKQCTIDGVTLEELLTKNTDISLTDNTLNEKQLGFIPDKSALSSTISTMETDYVKKTYKRQLAGAISAFAKNGLFLVDIKEEKTLNTFDNLTTYRCQYEDINGNKSTIRFDIPNIDSDNRFVTDGKPQVIKKQRIALPIIKINDHEVSLSSNYNKVRVYRNPNKAHNFGSYVYSLLSKKSTASVVYGHSVISEPISYEYTEVASKFREINFTKDKRRFSLFFGYNNRLEHFGGKEELFHKLEANYGTYFGYDDKNYYFVDVENQVYSVKKSGGENTENEFSCILDLIEYSLKQGEKIKSNFTEWLDITILNGKLPVIFCLAYKYGLRASLDYLGIKYTVTENRTNVITGGTESFTDTISGDNPYGDHWIDTPTKEDGSNEIDDEYEDDTDAYVTSDNTGNKYIVPEMKLDRQVKPRLGHIKLYFEKTVDKNAVNPINLKVKGMIVNIKLGSLHNVTRKITNFDGESYRCLRDGTLPKALVEKISNYLHCSERKVSRATIIDNISNTAIVKELSGIPNLTVAEYSQLTSRFTKGNEVFGSTVKYKKQSHDVVLKFADRIIHFNRYPISKSLVAAGLDKFDLSSYDLNEFEDKDVYFRLLSDAGISPNLLKGVDAMFDLFVDNITYQVLKSMNEPTNFRDLLIRCGVLLATKDHKDASSAANYRIRGYEQFAAIVYNEISRNVATYLKTAKTNKKTLFSVNPQAIYLRIIQNQSTMPAEAANPLEDVKIASNITYAGIGGRDGESFVQSDRIFAEDDVGILSEATADSGKVGMNAMSSFNPLISNTTGLLDVKSPEEVTPSNALSIHSLMMPFSSADDAKRMNFISIQCSHMIPVKTCEPFRIRTGYERVLAHRVTRTFAGIAEKDGKVTSIDEKSQLVEVTYTDGTKDVFKFGEQYIEAESIEITQPIVCAVSLGQSFKKGDVITYNSGYFTQDNFTKQLDFSIGLTANVAMLETDSTNEDSTEVSQALADKLAIYPVNERVVTLNAKALVHTCVKVGDTVSQTTPLMVFEDSPVDETVMDTDPEALALLSDINKSTPRAKFSGKIVKIDAYCATDELSSTVRSIVRDAVSMRIKANKLASTTDKAQEYPPVTIIPVGSKYKGVDFDKDTVMLIFHIQEYLPHGVGDKIVVCNQLKCTCASVFPKPVVTESGVPVDLFFSQKAQNNRIVLSPILTGIASRIMEKLETDVVSEYFK